MTTWVLDTSLIAKWFISEPDSERADKYLSACLEFRARICVPSLLFYELANVFWFQHRCAAISSPMELMNAAQRLPFHVTPWHELITPALKLSLKLDVSPYDASFLVLARSLDCEFITADTKLLRKIRPRFKWVKSLSAG